MGASFKLACDQKIDESAKPIHEAIIEEVARPFSEPAQFKCDRIGRFAYLGNCEKYYFCWDTTGSAFEFSCPRNKAFDATTQLCVYNFAVCATAPKCKQDRLILPNLKDKSTFFVCKWRHLSNKIVLRKKDCAEGREFNANLGYCRSIFPDDIVSSDSSDSSERVECEQPGIFIDLNRYYECIVKSVSKGTLKLIQHKCFDHHVFHMDKNEDVTLHGAWFKIHLLSSLVIFILKMQL